MKTISEKIIDIEKLFDEKLSRLSGLQTGLELDISDETHDKIIRETLEFLMETKEKFVENWAVVENLKQNLN